MGKALFQKGLKSNKSELFASIFMILPEICSSGLPDLGMAVGFTVALTHISDRKYELKETVTAV